MANGSITFIAFAFAVILAYNLVRSVLLRQMVLLLPSIGFLAVLSPSIQSYVPFVAFVGFGYLGLLLIEASPARAFSPVLIATIVLFVWLKKYSFVPTSASLSFPYVTIGLSYILFRMLHMMIDKRYGTLTGRIRVLPYVNYLINFTTLVAGPIQRYEDFARMQLSAAVLPLDFAVAGGAIERIIVGFFKARVLASIFSMLQARAIAGLAASQPDTTNLLDAAAVFAAYPFFLYCNFSGYIDIVIGLARLLGLALPENFNRPFSSDNFIKFWSRWHITLSEWLKTYVYTPLLMT